MVALNLEVLAKLGLYSNCSQKLDECWLARVRKSFVSAISLVRILVNGKTGKRWGNMHALRLFLENILSSGFDEARKNFSRKVMVPSKDPQRKAL